LLFGICKNDGYYSDTVTYVVPTMSLTPSHPLTIGIKASPFSLPDTRSGDTVSLEQYLTKPVLIAFICNHCPYVVHLMDSFIACAHQLARQNIATIAISANDASTYPADSPEKMCKLAIDKGFEFPYCHDASQSVAKAYGATCTPDLFLFDAEHKLYYHGQFDATRPGNGEADGTDLMQAAAQLLDQQPPPTEQKPSVGCSIKWKRH